MEKERLEARVVEERARTEKKLQGTETDVMRRLREQGQRHQEEVMEGKRQMWEEEKRYKTEINRLEYQLAEKKAELEEVKGEVEKGKKPAVGEADTVQMQILRHKLEEATMENTAKSNELKVLYHQK